MAFNEGLKQKIDLIGMLEAGRMMKDREEERKRAELQNKMMLEEMKQQQWRNQMEKAPDTMTVKGVGYDPRFGFGTEKRFLTDMPGMITGVSPETVYKNIGETDRAMISAMRGGYGGGGGGGQTQDPYSNYGPGQLEQMNAINEWQPQQAKPQANDIITQLGGLYRDGSGATTQPQPNISDLLAEEAQNKLGYESLLKQGGITGNDAASLMKDTAPLAAKMANESTLQIPKQIEQIKKIRETKLKEDAAIQKQKEKETARLNKYQAQLYKDKDWQGTGENPIPEEMKPAMLAELEKYVKRAIENNTEPDIGSFLDFFKKMKK